MPGGGGRRGGGALDGDSSRPASLCPAGRRERGVSRHRVALLGWELEASGLYMAVKVTGAQGA